MLAGAVTLCAAACSSPAPLAGQGGTCMVVTDCEDGLVCVPAKRGQPNGTRICSSDTSTLVPSAPAMSGMDGSAQRDGAPPFDGSADGRQSPADAGPSPADSGAPDANAD
ncbi:MAG: hypothetical protein ACREJ3_20325 [Polyangiaceae bacterium]